MKYFIIVVLLLCTGCDLTSIGDKLQDAYHYGKLKVPLSDIDYPDLDNYDSISFYIYSKIRYTSDPYDNWQSPAQTMDLKSGDCDDKSILFMEILYKSMGVKANLIAVDTNQYKNRTVVNGGTINHAIVEINGKPYDPQTGEFVLNALVKFRYTFDEVFAQ